MTRPDPDWSSWLAERISARGTPGASLALDLGGQTVLAVAGLADLERAAPVTPQTIFRLGSSTKLLTALLLVQIASERGIDLDAPVVRLWRDFAIADEAARRTVTTRHLLSHSAGIYGDVFDETSTGSDALARYARDGSRFEQTSPPGRCFSYSNASFALAGRLTEILTGEVWDHVLARRVLRPLGMSRSGVVWNAWPDQDVATSYLPDGPVRNEPYLRALAPAGSTPWGAAGDLLMLARALTRADGEFHDAAIRMQGLAIAGPTPTFARGWGLGVQRFDDAGAVWGHDGVVPGQMTFLRLAPRSGLHIALMSNGGDGRGLMDDLLERLAARPGEPVLPPGPTWPLEPPALDADRYVGRYAVARASIDVRASDGDLIAEMATTDGLATQILRRRADDPSGELFLTCLAPGQGPLQQRFHLPAGGRAQSDALLYRGRLYPRQDASAALTKPPVSTTIRSSS